MSRNVDRPSPAVSSGFGARGADSESVFRIKPYHYIHVLDNNTGITRILLGPQTFTRQEHEKVLGAPEPMIVIPPRNFAIISNPVELDDKGHVARDEHGNYKLRHGDEEIRFSCDPFPLYPGEKLFGKVTPLQVVAHDSALRLRCIRDFVDGDKKLAAGDEWLFRGPGTYLPRVEVQAVEVVHALHIKPDQALLVRARNKCIDHEKKERKAGEEWLVRKVGAYLADVDEEVVETKDAYVLTDKIALHLKATRTYVDTLGFSRKAGEEWLVTADMTPTYIPDVFEEVVGQVKITTLKKREYATILDPVGADGKPQYGKKNMVVGETSFFLKPGEKLESGIQPVFILGEQEALLLRAKEEFEKHAPGDRWMIYGPQDYVPPVQVEVVERRRAIALDSTEGIYVRDIKTGRVRAEIGKSYMLLPNEELWEKQLPPVVEELLKAQGFEPILDKTRVIRVRVPHNSAIQIYDYKDKKSRVVFGPELILLGPDEHLTVLSLSGGKPKKPHQIQAFNLMLGPDFMTDIVTVETLDHARLQLRLSYNWHFEIDKENPARIFQLPDFVGDACKAIASSVRNTVASVSFDNFHRNSAKVIRTAVFGTNEEGKINNRFTFAANSLIITNIDIQSVEPVDQRTRDSLQKSVQLAIEITTKSQEAVARHEAQRTEQEAKGLLERQKINDERQNELSRQELLHLHAKSSFVESTGQATAEAKARTRALEIEAEGSVSQAERKALSQKLEQDSELELLKTKRELEVDHLEKMQALEIEHSRSLGEIESGKFKAMIGIIGPETIATIARAGPETQAQLLEGLGIKSLMITDGNSPINLFHTANGLIGNQVGH